LSGRGLCDEPITRPEEFYRQWCVVVCDLQNLKNEEAMTRVGSQRHKKTVAGKLNKILSSTSLTRWQSGGMEEQREEELLNSELTSHIPL
jgi:hypothetical protein